MFALVGPAGKMVSRQVVSLPPSTYNSGFSEGQHSVAVSADSQVSPAVSVASGAPTALARAWLWLGVGIAFFAKSIVRTQLEIQRIGRRANEISERRSMGAR